MSKNRRLSSFRKLLLGAFAVSGLLLQPGCSGFGPKMVKPSRYSYNESIAQSANEQLLLNIVRLRYQDTPFFLQLSSVVSQYKANFDAEAGKGNKNGRFHMENMLLFKMGVSEQPTLTYKPMGDDDFAQRLLTPIQPSTLWLLSHSGWSIDRLMVCCVQKINDVNNVPIDAALSAKNASRFVQFQELSRLFNSLEDQGVLESRILADGDTRKNILHIRTPETPNQAKDLSRLRELLNLSTETTDYVIQPSYAGLGFDRIGIQSRSVLGTLLFLSQGVDVPESHNLPESGISASDEASFAWGTESGNIMKISSSRQRPSHAFVKVWYRGYWFYIDDADSGSKASFNLASYLFTLQAVESRGDGPLLTLSVSS